jgi:hypothetical protein
MPLEFRSRQRPDVITASTARGTILVGKTIGVFKPG